ncbi:MAG TPA: bifunctional hydroxymethylpyrimidine kinase/phosphomethylpyrimidine kinase [Kofleriaceae bacterium]|nr:bifunctional hydroxymethylpyrimidine kinase/phosphomethylpyrimidine kinase [Kofleriaceae bacterium]
MNILVISGLDPSGGAGFVADARMIDARGGRPVGVVTALTVQDTRGVREVHPCSAEVLSDQLRALLSDLPVAAVKIGMLGSQAIALAVADALELTRAPVVWDPVLRSSLGGAALFVGDAAVAATALKPHVTVATPNATEAAALSGRAVTTVADARAVATLLCRALGDAVLITGGHLAAGDEVVDVLAEGDVITELRAERIDGATEVHGTGCALSSALAVELGRGTALPEAVRIARDEVVRRLRAPVTPGRGSRAVL